MARKAQIQEEEIPGQSNCVIPPRASPIFARRFLSYLAAELDLDAERRRIFWGQAAGQSFVIVAVFAIKTTPAQIMGWPSLCCMSLEEEQEFLCQWESKATKGGVLTVPPIHAALVKRLGALPMSTTYRLLARHGWRKVQPDTKHPKSDPALQDEFKKNFPKRWQPPA